MTKDEPEPVRTSICGECQKENQRLHTVGVIRTENFSGEQQIVADFDWNAELQEGDELVRRKDIVEIIEDRLEHLSDRISEYENQGIKDDDSEIQDVSLEDRGARTHLQLLLKEVQS